MSLTAKDYIKKFEPAPAGLAIARCFRVIDLGWQHNQFGSQYEIAIAWELMDKLMQDGKPYVVHREYHHSYHDNATLFKHLSQWRGKNLTEDELENFHLSRLIGKTCQLYIEHAISKKTGVKRAVVQSLSPLPAKLACPAPVNKPLVFSLDEATEAQYLALPEYIKKRITWPPIKATQAQSSHQSTANYHESVAATNAFYAAAASSPVTAAVEQDFAATSVQPIPTFNPAIEDNREEYDFDEDVPF